MSEEKLSCEQQCASCPNRSRLSRVMAKLAFEPDIAEGCEGYVVVSRGQIIAAERQPGEPKPEGKWNCFSWNTDSNVRRYARTVWRTERVCGREVILPAMGEVIYADDSTDENGHRWMAFISGEEQDIINAQFAIGLYKSEVLEETEQED